MPDLTGQPLIIVLLCTAIGALSTAIIILWKALGAANKRGDDAVSARVEDAKQTQEKFIALVNQVNETVGILNDVYSRPNKKGQ